MMQINHASVLSPNGTGSPETQYGTSNFSGASSGSDHSRSNEGPRNSPEDRQSLLVVEARAPARPAVVAHNAPVIVNEGGASRFTRWCAAFRVTLSVILLVVIISLSSVMVHDYSHHGSSISSTAAPTTTDGDSSGECVIETDLLPTHHLPTNSSYQFEVDSSRYSAIKYTFVQPRAKSNVVTTTHSINFILRSKHDKKITSTYIETDKKCDLQKSIKTENEDCFIVRHWPDNGLTQSGYVSCAFEEDDKSGYLIWKWVSLNDSFDIDCSDLNIKDSNPKKRWHKCGKNYQPRELDIKKVLNDKERLNHHNTVVMQFCLMGNDDQGVVKYDVNFTEEWERYIEPYNLYTIDDHYDETRDSTINSVDVPLTSQDTIVDIIVQGGNKIVSIEQQGIRKTASFMERQMHISVFSGAVTILVGAVVLILIECVWCVRFVWEWFRRNKHVPITRH